MKKSVSILLTLLLLLCLYPASLANARQHPATVCVLPGLNPEQVFTDNNRLKHGDPFSDYKIIILDAEYFTPAQIRILHKKGHLVYSYLNIGSLENTREDYEDYKDLCLAPYENWPEESWVDVTQKRWQDRCNRRGKQLIAKGVDGFFIDNTDVYDLYHTVSVKKSLDVILTKLHAQKNSTGVRSAVMINGGSSYVSAKLKEKKKNLPFTAVCQESVYNHVVNYEKQIFKKNHRDAKAYYLTYLKKCKKAGLFVLVLDYEKKSARIKTIRKACKKSGFGCYISTTLELNQVTPVQ
ncbi:Glycoside-hydrolase family GH114 [Lachnospiraceae bacterium KHCPX20]|nr:Glycoside-hydrolase family GH114 [Lachnospiraceae bacterium KHCPX20]